MIYKSNRKSTRGVVLLDAIIGLAILCMAAATGFTASNNGFRNTETLDRKFLATIVAKNRASDLKINIHQMNGVSFNDVAEVQGGISFTSQLNLEKVTGTLSRVRITVYQSSDLKRALITLDTYIPTELVL